MDEKLQFVARRLAGEQMADLCREFGISRKTGYKIFDRYKECGVQGLTDRSRRPHLSRSKTRSRLKTVKFRSRRERITRGLMICIACHENGQRVRFSGVVDRAGLGRQRHDYDVTKNIFGEKIYAAASSEGARDFLFLVNELEPSLEQFEMISQMVAYFIFEAISHRFVQNESNGE